MHSALYRELENLMSHVEAWDAATSNIAQSFGSIHNLHLHLQVCPSCLYYIAQSALQTTALSKGE